ncbi:M23 family metallopeptidase [Thermosynechococcus sichuanensis E542]|uniref:M23 family metallopeptidase n=1 Tax=Thermosynechococcus sichuanensis E542 TaxID=2016101 RepID=A0A3B7MJ16_9CYAN|nr:M23 family metallopeptidase [Thermosynechococcus vestitus]AXY67890.1 M23 family metallopeptidase [Thermosynechococcus vestitus E542]
MSDRLLPWLIPAIITVTVLPASSQVTMPLTVTVSPDRAVLGDTLAIVVNASEQPTVEVAGKALPVFSIGPQQWRAFVATTPLQTPGRRSLVVRAGNETRNMLLWVGDRAFPVQRIWLPAGKDTSGTDFEFDRVAAFKALVTPEKLWQGAFRRPNSGPVTTPYGVRRYYDGVFAKDYFHRGLDYAGAKGSPVVAAQRGRVALVGRESQGFLIHGNTVGIDHGQGVLTIYLHLDQIRVQEGQMFEAGQVIGTVGNTGASTGPHLHWGLYVNGECVDPRSWLAQGWQ